VRAPTLVVNGLSDAPWLQDLSVHIAASVPGARRVDLPDTGHLPPLERPEESTRLIAGHAAS
jgi:pimeloyl-ACP methyl ester carboxylesterase